MYRIKSIDQLAYLHNVVSKKLPEDQSELIYQKTLGGADLFISFTLLSNFVFQLEKSFNIDIQDSQACGSFIFCWLIWFIVLVLHVQAKRKGNIQMYNKLILLILIRNLLPYFDLENSRQRLNKIEVVVFLFQ